MSALKPDAVASHDLGTSSLPWQNLHVDQITMGARAGGTTLTIGSEALLTGGTSTDLVVHGNLTVNGSTTTLSSTELVIEDKTITLASGAADSAAADGAGITVDGASATLLYDHTGTQWEFNKPLEVQGNVLPQADDSFALGSTSLGWADVFVTHEGSITFVNAAADAADLTLTHSTDLLTISGGNTRVDRLEIDSAADYIDVDTDLKLVSAADILLDPTGGDVKVDGALLPNVTNTTALGSTDNQWSDLWLGSGAVVNFATSDVLLTHSADLLTISGGNTRVDRLELDSASHHIDVDTGALVLTSAGNIKLVTNDNAGGTSVLVDGNLLPNTSDSNSLGGVANEWSDLYLADGGIIKLGDDQEVTLTHVADAGILLNSTNQLQFGDAGSFIHQSADGVLSLSTDGATGQDLKLIASNAAGGVFVDAGTGGIDIDSEGRFRVTGLGVASSIELATGAADNIDLTMSVTGGGDSSLVLSSSGTGTDAIDINATAGGIDIDANGSLNLDGGSINIGTASDVAIDIDASTLDIDASGAFTLTSTSMALDPSTTFDLDATGAITVDGASLSVGSDNDTGAISLKSTSANLTLTTATSGNIIASSVGTLDVDAASGATINTTSAAADIALDAEAGSIIIDAGEAVSDAIKIHASGLSGGIDIDAGTEGIDLDSTGQVNLASSKDAADAIVISASAGGIDISATGSAGEDIDISASGSSINISSTEAASDAIKLSATTGAGGIDIDAGSSGVDLDASGQVALTSSKAAADAIVIEASDATGGIDLSAGGGVVVSIDADSVDISQDVVISGTTPTLTIGDAGEEDASLIFDGNAVDFHIGLDDSADKLSIGLGSVLGTTPNMTLNSADRDVTFAGDIEVQGGKITLSNGATIDSETEGELILTETLVKAEGNLTVTGNLTVQGDTTTVNTATLDVEDANITLNKGGAAASAAGSGIDFEEDGSITGYVRVADDDRSNLDLKAPSGSELKLDINSDATFAVSANLTVSGPSDINQDLTTDAAVTFASVDADGGVTVDNLTLDGQSLALSAGDFTLDVAGNIILDADGGNLSFADSGTSLLSLSNATSDVVIKPVQADKDIVFTSDDDTEIARFDSDANSLLMASGRKIQLGAAEESVYGDGTDIHFEVGAGGDINIPTNIGLNFDGSNSDSFKIESNGTDLTIASGGDLELSTLGAVRVTGVLEFGGVDSGEQISTDGTDLILASDADIQLSATAAVVVPSGVSLEFGADSGESISGDGTDLTIVSGGNIVLNATSAVLPSVDSEDDLGAEGTAWRKIYVDDIDLNGQGRIDLDADADTSIRASADDVISFEIGGEDKLFLNSAGLRPQANDGLELGSTANSFSDLYLADAGVISFQDNLSSADITLTHVRDSGLALKNLNTTDAGGAVLTLQTGDTDISVNDVLGSVEFQAPDEGTGTDAVLVAAAISAVSEGDFAADSNATKLSFKTGSSETASEKLALSSAGDLSLVVDAASVKFGADSEVSLQHVHNAGLLLNSSSQLQFRDADVHISSDADGHINVQADTQVSLNIGGEDELAITASTATFGTDIVVPDGATIGSASDADAITINASGDVALSSTTGSSSPETGALKVAGGVGITENLSVGGATELDGTLKVVLQDFTIANAAGSVERFKVAGGSGNTEIAGTLEVDGNCTLGNASSDLHTVNGGLTITGVSTTSNVISGGARNMDGSEYVYLVNADNVTITLPSISGAEAAAGQRFIIKRTAAHTEGVTINRDGTDLIDGGTSVTLGAAANGIKSFIEIISDGTDYHIITSGGTVTVS